MRQNNFDFLRLIFAIFVIISHSYPLVGRDECDLLCQFTQGQISFSYLGVKGFFVLSGYLIFHSLQRSKSVFNYFRKRLLRIYPALIMMLVLTMIFVPFMYSGEVAIIQNTAYLKYLPYNLTLYGTQHYIPGVFAKNPHPNAINASLWTIPYEFTLYIALSLLYFVRNPQKTKFILLITFFGLICVNLFFMQHLKDVSFILRAGHIIDLSCFFVAGSLLASFKIEFWRLKRAILLISIVLMVLVLYGHIYSYFEFVLLPIIVLLTGLMPFEPTNKFIHLVGDLSYGIYIYAFPVQQTLVHFLHLDLMELMICSTLFSATIAYFSWHYIEKKALRHRILQK